MLETTVLILAVSLMLADLLADILYGILNPRMRLRRQAPAA